MLLCAILCHPISVFMPHQRSIGQLQVNGLIMAYARVWLAIICTASILVSATDAPLNRTSVCRPCPDSCVCRLLLNDGTCSVDCAGAGLSTFPLNLPSGKRKIVLDLDNNNLTDLQIHHIVHLSHLKSICLANNPWFCGCATYWSSRWLEESAKWGVEIVGTAETRCHSPMHLKNIPLMQIGNLSHLCSTTLDLISYVRADESGQTSVRIDYMVESSSALNSEEDGCDQFCFDQDFPVAALSTLDGLCRCGRPSIDHKHDLIDILPEPAEGSMLDNKFYIRNAHFIDAAFYFRMKQMAVSTFDTAIISVDLPIVPSHCDWKFGENGLQSFRYFGIACRLVRYRYVWPGFYTIKTVMSSVNGSVQASRNISIVVQDPINAIVSPFQPFVVPAHRPFTVTIMMSSGTNVSITWNILNSSEAIEIETVGRLIDVPKYVAGIGQFSQMVPAQGESIPHPPISPHNETTLYLFPGWWFTHSGILQKWIYYMNDSVTSSILHFQVYRPHCVNATSYLLHPESGSEYTMCSNDEQFSTFEHNCSSGLQYCPLSKACQLRQSACTCRAPHIDGTGSCVNTTNEWHQLMQNMPDYSLVGDWPVDSDTADDGVRRELLSTNASIEVQRNDIIALQFVSNVPPVRCVHDIVSPWRQRVIAIHQSSWMVGRTEISGESLALRASILDDVVCDVMAVYSRPELITSQLLSANLTPGVHTALLNLSNLISFQTNAIELTAVAEIEEFRLMFPTRDLFRPHPVSGDSIGKLIVEADTYTTFVFSIAQGSTVQLTSSIDSTQIQFESVCPMNLPPEFVCNSSLLYAIKRVAFAPAQNISGLRVAFTARNEVCVKTIVCDVLSLRHIRNINLTRNATQGWPSFLDVHIFNAVVSGDILVSSYHWTTSDGLNVVSDFPQLKHIFSTAGQHNVSVNASNELSFQTSTLNVTLYQPSDVNISCRELPNVVPTGRVVAVHVLLEMKTYSIVRCNFTVLHDFVSTVNTTTSVVYFHEGDEEEKLKNVSFQFYVLHPGVYDIQVVALDELLPGDHGDETRRVSAAIDAEDPITGLALHISNSTQNKGFTYLFTASVTTGSNMTLSFKIGESVVTTSQLSIEHTFTKNGLYLVQLEATNRVSRRWTNEKVNISSDELLPEGLALIGCCSQVFSTEKNISFALKVEKDSQKYYDCAWLIVHRQKLIAYHEGYHVTFHVRSPGDYSVAVILRHRGEMKHNLTDRFIVQEPVSLLHLYTNAGFDGVFIHQELACTAIHTAGSHLHYQWNITAAKSGIFEITKIHANRMTALFYSNNTYEVHVVAKNDISNASTSAIIRVIVCNPPVLQLVGSTHRQELRSQRIAVEVIVQSCIFHQTSHKWIVYRDNCSVRIERVPLPPSISTDTSALHLPPRSLPYGMYCLHFSSEYVRMVNRSEIFVDLDIVASPLKALIFGGDERALTVNEKIILDGTQSYDPDVDEDELSQITYSWSCQTSSHSDDHECFRPSNQSIYELCPHTFKENITYVISLSVASSKRGQTHSTSSSTAVQKIHGKSADMPQVSINCISCRDKNLFAITRSQIIKLVGNCIGELCQEDDDYSWSVKRNDSYELPLNTETTTTGGDKRNLVVREFILDCRYSYTFTLYVSSSVSDVVGYASIVLKPLQAPKNGTCSLRIPQSGFVVALVNPVFVVCKGWIDDASSASQLEYHIYVNETGRLNHRWYPLYRGPRGNLTFFLSPFRNDTELVELTVQVIDSEGSMTKAVKQLINVTSPPSRMELLASLIFEELEQEVNHDDPRQIIPRIIAILLQLNIESQNGNSSEEAQLERERMRTELMMYLNQTMTIGAIQDMQQVAFAMQLVTDVPSEFSRDPVHYHLVLRTLEDLIEKIKPYISQGWQGEEFMPSYLLDTSTNLIDNLYFFDRNGQNLFDSENSRHRQTIEAAANLVDLIMVILFQTKIAEEEPVSFYTTLVHCWGHRISSKNVLLTFTGPGSIVSFPEALTSLDEHMEVFQYVSTFDYNPFQWGFLDGSPVTSKVVTVSFYDTQGQEVDLPQLPDDQGIEISVKMSDDVPKEVDDDYSTDVNTSTASAANETTKSSASNPVPPDETDLHISLLPRESKSALIKLSASSFSAMGLTFKVVSDADNETMMSADDDDALNNITMMVYIGQNYVPHKYKSEYSFQLMLQRHNITGRHHAHSYHFLSPQPAVESNGSFYLTFVNNAIELSLDIVLSFHAVHCKYFNKEDELWDTNGCTAVNATEKWTTCKCSKLWTVGASNFPVPAVMEFVPLTGMVFSGNPIVITTAMVVLIFVIAGFVLAWYWDHVEMVRLSLVPLCGKDGPFRYEVLIFTGKLIGSGTTANVGMRLHGEVDRSQNLHLFRPGAFRRGAQDRFVIANQTSLGCVEKLVIWHDNTGSHPDWSLTRVAVRDLQTNVIYHFLANCTLSLKSSKMEIEKTVSVATESDLSRFCNRFRFDVSYRHSEQHLWLSVLDCCYSGHRFSHAYRLLCCATSLCCILAISTIYYGFMERQSDYEELMGESSFKPADVLLAIISSAISFICSFLLLEAFRATKQQVSQREMLSRRQSISVMIEMDCDISGRETSSQVGSFSSFAFESPPTRNVLHPSDFLELDVDRLSDSTSLNQQPVIRKQLHRTSVLTSARQSVSQTGIKMMSNKTTGSDSLMPIQSADSHLWSSEMILNSWPQRVNDLSTVRDDDRVWSDPEGLCTNATRNDRGKRLVSTSAPNITESSQSSAHHPRKNKVKRLDEGRRAVSEEETAFDSGAIVSEQDEGSVDDDDLQVVYTIPVQSSSHSPSTALKAEHCYPTCESQRSNSKKSMQSVFKLPHCFSYVTWLLCVGIISGSMIVILFIGHQFNTDLSLRWFAVSCSAFLLAAVVLESLKVVIISIICSTKMRLIDLDAYQIFRCLSLEANEQFKSVRFRPLAGFALLQAKEEAKRSLLLQSLLRKLFIYVGLLAVVFAVNYAPNAGNTAFLLSKSLDTMLVQTRFNKNESFKTISCSDDYWNWLESVYVSQLCTDGHAWNESSHYQYLIGPSRLRQLRSKKVSCLVRNKYGDKVGSEYDLCDGDPGWYEDTAFYQPHWKPAFEEANDTWKFHSAHSLNSIPYKGILGWYGGGGYVSLLPSSYTDAIEKINKLMSEDWIDDGTRVVMLEFTIYNGNVDLFASVVMVVEFGLTGATYTTWHTYIFHPFVYPSADVTAMILLESFLFIYAIYLTIEIVMTIRKSCARFFKDIWTYVNVLITCLCWSSVILFVLMVLLDTWTHDHVQNNSNGSTFVDFRESGATHFVWVCINAFLLMLTLILAVKQLRFVKLFATFYLAFRVSFCVIFGCTLIYSLLMVIYCLTAYLWFGSELLQFHSVGASFVTLVAIFRGDAQVMVAMGEAHLGFTIVFIAVYMSAVWFGVHSLIAGAFTRAYGMMRKQVNYHNAMKAHDHEIIPFLMKQLKKWIQKDKSKAAFRKVKFQDFSTLSTVSSARSSLPFDDDALSAVGDEISDDSESSPELHENDAIVLHLVTDSTETVQDDLHSSLGEEDVTISASCDEVATILSSFAAEVSVSSLVEDSVDQEIAVPNLASQQPKDVTDGHGDLSADIDSSSDYHANPDDVLSDMDDSIAITSNDPVESVIPAVTRVLEQLDKIGSMEDDVDWRIKAATEKYLRKRINYHRNSSSSHRSVDERNGRTKILLEAGQEANPDRSVVCSQVSPCPPSEVEMTRSAFLAMPPADLQNQDMTTCDIGEVPMRTVAPQQTDRLLATSHQETWV